jgi:hypothetical protein
MPFPLFSMVILLEPIRNVVLEQKQLMLWYVHFILILQGLNFGFQYQLLTLGTVPYLSTT